jgi:ABC-type bacteriocin/lantibiotic exporter with double-glycine peptidase domain
MFLLAFYHPMLLAFDLLLIASLYLVLFVMGRNGIVTAIEQSKAKYLVAAWLETIAANPLLSKSRQGEAFIDQQSKQIAENYLSACVNHFRILSRQNIGALVLHTLANTSLLALGGWMVIERELSLGQLIAAELVVNAMIYGLTRLGKTLDNFYELVASVDKIGYLLDLPQEPNQGELPQANQSAYQINIQNLSVLKGPQIDQINQLDLTLAAGENLVISEGAERGTLLDILYGLRSYQAGNIYFNSDDLRDLNLGALRDNVSLVREAEILNLSIADNVSIGRDLGLNQIRTALKQVGLLELISSLADGLQTPLSSNGEPLNSEQQLRLTLARAIAGSPKLLMIDKTLDHIDRRFLPSILAVLLAPDANWTLIIISQQADVIERCQRHARIVNGQLQPIIADSEVAQ